MRRTPASRLAAVTRLCFASLLASCIAEIGDIEPQRGRTGGTPQGGGATPTTATGSTSGGSGDTTGEGGRGGDGGSGGDSSATSTGSAGATASGGAGGGTATGGGAGSAMAGAGGSNTGPDGGTGGRDAGAMGGGGGRADAGGIGGADAGSAPTFRQVSPVVSRNCARCHASWPNYSTLTTHRVNQCGGNVLVKPNDVKNSALLQVVQGQCGTLLMPKNCAQTPCIAAADIQLITRWIESGAPNN